MAAKRMSLAALAKSRGIRLKRFGSHIEGYWADSDCWVFFIDMPTRRVAEAGLRAALEAMPVKARTK